MTSQPMPTTGPTQGISPCGGTHAPQIEGCEGVEMYPIWPFQLFGPLQTASQVGEAYTVITSLRLAVDCQL